MVSNPQLPSQLSSEKFDRTQARKEGSRQPSIETSLIWLGPGINYRKTCGSRRAIILLDNWYSPQSVAPVLTLYTTCRSYAILFICTSILFGIAVFLFLFLRARISRAGSRGSCSARDSEHCSRWTHKDTSTWTAGCTAILMHA